MSHHSEPFSTLLIGCGTMGSAHARAYRAHPAFELVGCVSRGPSGQQLAQELGAVPYFSDFREALEMSRPQVVCISTFTESHAEIALAALEAGAHVFIEKPLAPNLQEAQMLIDAASRAGLVLYVGYILRVHSAWQSFISAAQGLGKPLVMRLSLNQKSQGAHWQTQQALLKSGSPLLDCGVHYVDVMQQMCGARPVCVSAIGAALGAAPDCRQETAPEAVNQANLQQQEPSALAPETSAINYGQLQIRFDDASVGWFEAGWGPMMSEVAANVRDVIGSRGSTQLPKLAQEPSLEQLCADEQELFFQAISGKVDLTKHHQAVLSSTAVVLAAEESLRSGKTVFI